MTDPVELGRQVVGHAEHMGFALAGVAPAQPSSFADELTRWLDDGRHATMAWLERNTEQRLDPRTLLDGARSVLLVADQYAPRGDTDDPRPGTGRIARYARGEDYHRVIRKRLHALCDDLRDQHPDAGFRTFVDTAPVLEREHAARAAIGWIGKHTLLINPTLGSYLLLGGVVTTLDLQPPDKRQPIADHCGTCTRCIDACPTDAITPYSVDASRCISYLTIEHRDVIAPAFHPSMADWIFGCDICQEVCPHNSPRDAGPDRVHPAYLPRRDGFDLLELLAWTEQQRREAFTTSALKRAKLDMIRRNALIAAGNTLKQIPDGRIEARVREIAADRNEADVVRRTAQDVIGSLD